jgi:methylglutamate dehydrogenase subunit D
MAATATKIARSSPLQGIARPGHFGAEKGAPVELSVRHPVSIVTVIARKGRSSELAAPLAALTNSEVLWAGFEQYYVVADDRPESALYNEINNALGSLATVCDQSHGRTIIRIAGSKSRALLAKGTAVDLHPAEFPIGKCALTQTAHIVVHLVRTGEDSFELSVFRGFAESFWEWLTQQAEEFGYRVT